MKVKVRFEDAELTTGMGQPIYSVVAICQRCGHQTESYGTTHKSKVRCLFLMKEECPNDENNFYVDEDE